MKPFWVTGINFGLLQVLLEIRKTFLVEGLQFRILARPML